MLVLAVAKAVGLDFFGAKSNFLKSVLRSKPTESSGKWNHFNGKQ